MPPDRGRHGRTYAVCTDGCTVQNIMPWAPSIGQTYTHTHPFNGPLSRTTQVSWYQKGKTKLDFTEARDSEWQWNPLVHMQVCISLQTDNHASTPPLSFLQARCPSCRPANSIKALKGFRHLPLTWCSLTAGRSYFVRRRTDRCSVWSSDDRDLATNNASLN